MDRERKREDETDQGKDKFFGFRGRGEGKAKDARERAPRSSGGGRESVSELEGDTQDGGAGDASET